VVGAGEDVIRWGYSLAPTAMVTCPDCAFTFDAGHTDEDGGWSCANCAETALALRVQKLRDALTDVTHTVIAETEPHVHGKPSYNMTLDHLHDVAVAAREVLYDD
jgi:hypothetical protein